MQLADSIQFAIGQLRLEPWIPLRRSFSVVQMVAKRSSSCIPTRLSDQRDWANTIGGSAVGFRPYRRSRKICSDRRRHRSLGPVSADWGSAAISKCPSVHRV